MAIFSHISLIPSIRAHPCGIARHCHHYVVYNRKECAMKKKKKTEVPQDAIKKSQRMTLNPKTLAGVMAEAVYWSASILEKREFRPTDLYELCTLFGYRQTKADCCANVSRWRHHQGEPVLRFAPGIRLTVVGTTGAAKPEKLVATYRKTNRTCKRSR